MQAGLDSLGAVELRNAMTEEFGLPMPATLAFDYPTKDALVQFITAQMLSDMQAGGKEHVPHSIHESQWVAQKESSTEVLAVACRYPGCANGESCHLPSMAPQEFHTDSIISHNQAQGVILIMRAATVLAQISTNLTIPAPLQHSTAERHGKNRLGVSLSPLPSSMRHGLAMLIQNFPRLPANVQICVLLLNQRLPQMLNPSGATW